MPGQPLKRARLEAAQARAQAEYETRLYLEEVIRTREAVSQAESDYVWALRQAIAHGHSQAEIARELGLTRQAIQWYLSSHKPRQRKRRETVPDSALTPKQLRRREISRRAMMKRWYGVPYEPVPADWRPDRVG